MFDVADMKRKCPQAQPLSIVAQGATVVSVLFEFPCKDVVVYCIACERAMGEAGKAPEQKFDLLDEYHQKPENYIQPQ